VEGPVSLDSLMPNHDVSEVHHVTVAATSDEVWAALQQVSLGDVPVFRLLMSGRELPGRVVGRRWLTGEVDRPLLEQMVAVGFVPLEARPGVDLALGLLTRPWLLGRGSIRAADRESFLAFDEPGWAKAVLAFALTAADGDVTVLRTETRVTTTDVAARRLFRAYWAFVGWGSAVTRRSWLAAVKRRAEGLARPAP